MGCLCLRSHADPLLGSVDIQFIVHVGGHGNFDLTTCRRDRLDVSLGGKHTVLKDKRFDVGLSSAVAGIDKDFSCCVLTMLHSDVARHLSFRKRDHPGLPSRGAVEDVNLYLISF